MKKNSQKKALQLQSEFKIGDLVISLIDTTFLTKGDQYIIGGNTKKGIYLIEIPRVDDYPEHFFVKATELNKALL